MNSSGALASFDVSSFGMPPDLLRFRRAASCLLGLVVVFESEVAVASHTGSPELRRNTPAADEALIAGLLAKPAPPRDWREYLKHRAPAVTVKPAADAPAEELLDYWHSAKETEAPDEPTRGRLLDICESTPTEIPLLLPFLQLESAAVQDRLKHLYDQISSERTEQAASSAQLLRDALMYHSSYFREELVRRAFWPDDVVEDDASKAMESLVRLDRAAAFEKLRGAAVAPDALRRAVALTALLHHFADESAPADRDAWRDALQRLVISSEAPMKARRRALLTVTADKSDDTVAWFIGLFRIPTLDALEEYSTRSTPLGDVLADDPDFWIPKVVPLVRNKDQAVHANAVHALIQFNNDRARADALRPLLPWLADPKWAPEPKELLGRLRLIQSLDQIDLPEAIPALLKISARENGYELQAAAEALAHHHAREAIGPLKASLKREKAPDQIRAITRAIVVLGGFSPQDTSDALTRYAVAMSTAAGSDDYEKASSLGHNGKLDWRVFAGQELARTELTGDDTAIAVLESADRLAEKNPVAADLLRQFTVKWQTPTAIRFIEDRLRAGSITADWVEQLVASREKLSTALGALSGLRGTALGVQAALRLDKTRHDAVLQGGDVLAQRALFATARLGRVSLPIAASARLLDSGDKELANAAELYLEADDSATAREAIWTHHPNEARIVGGSPGFYGDSFRGSISEREKSLTDIIRRNDGPEEIFALLSEGTWGGRGQRSLLAYKDRAVVRCDDGNGRVREQNLRPEQFVALRRWLEREQVDELPAFDAGAMDGVQYQYLHLRRVGGLRVYMNNPPGANAAPRVEFVGDDALDADAAIYGELTARLSRLDELPLKVGYPTLQSLPGLRVVHANEQGEVTAIAKRGDALLAGIRVPADQTTEWHAVSSSGLANAAIQTPPDLLAPLRKRRFPEFLDDDPVPIREGPFAGEELWQGTRRKDDLDGLWLSAAEGEPRLVVPGRFALPLICPGGQWVVAAKTFGENMWDKPNEVVRIDLETKHVYPVALPPADNFDPLVWVNAHRRVLLYQKRDEDHGEAGPETPQFFLLDPATGDVRRVEGDFRPLMRLANHELQPTDCVDEVWAVVHEGTRAEITGSVLGRYDTKRFVFVPCMRFPGVIFDSWQTYVDLEDQVVWIVVNGDLLQLPANGCKATP